VIIGSVDVHRRRRSIAPWNEEAAGVTLRKRLALILGVLVFVPLAAAGLLVSLAVPRADQNRLEYNAASSRQAVAYRLQGVCQLTAVTAHAVAQSSASVPPRVAVREAVAGLPIGGYAAMISGETGRVIASAGTLPDGVSPGSLRDCANGEAAGAVVASSVALSDGRGALDRVWVASSVGGPWPANTASELAIDGEVALVQDGQLVSPTSNPSPGQQLAPEFVALAQGEVDVVSGHGYVAAVQKAGPGGQPYDIVVVAPVSDRSSLMRTVVVVVLLAVLIAALLGGWLARDLTSDLEELTDAVESVAAGHLGRTITVRKNDETGRLAAAFNHMTAELRSYISALESSRDEMRSNLHRLGEALSATHDLDSLLPVVLQTARTSVAAGAGVVMLSVDGGPLVGYAEQGMAAQRLRAIPSLPLGVGVLGRVAKNGTAVRGRMGEEPLRPAPGEPIDAQVLAVPLERAPNVLGVLAVFAPGDAAFTADDEAALATLAGQAAIAVENVLLHGEAKRMSVTDPLTGLANFRSMSTTLNSEIERAVRFHRPLGLLMLDLDHFKEVNDMHGHARGDDVLRELSRRVSGQVREVDVFARYGGEEFVLILPETDRAGVAAMARRVCEVVRATPFRDGGGAELSITISIGGASFAEDGTTGEALLRAADEALYRAKRAGRNGWALAASGAASAGSPRHSR
jgi:two-component system cell cycle response regulator